MATGADDAVGVLSVATSVRLLSTTIFWGDKITRHSNLAAAATAVAAAAAATAVAAAAAAAAVATAAFFRSAVALS